MAQSPGSAVLEISHEYSASALDEIIIGSAVINQIQDEVYSGAPWQHEVPEEQVCVLHTLMICPAEFGRGHAGEFLDFYERYALENGWPELRIDTNDRNLPAQAMYLKHGFRKIAVMPTKVFNGILDVNLVLMEKYLDEEEEAEK